jgi:hypothetical protein
MWPETTEAIMLYLLLIPARDFPSAISIINIY